MNKEQLLKSTSILLAGCITFESCEGGLILDLPSDEISLENSTALNDTNSIAVNVRYSLDESSIKYLEFINQLATDIINDSTVAKEFIKAPNSYLNSYGFEENVNINPRLTNCILALADTDICNSAKKGNIAEYIQLMRTKGYIDKAFIHDINNIYNDNNSNKKTNFITLHSSNSQSIQASAVAFAIMAVVGAVVAVWAVVVEHFAAGNAIFYLTVLTTSYKGKGLNRASTNIHNSSLISAWKLKSGSSNSYIASHKMTEEIISSTIKEIRSSNNPDLNSISDEELRAFILINLQCYDIQ